MKNIFVLILVSVFVSTGCTSIDKQAFEPGKTYAVVSTYTDRVKVPDPHVTMLDKEKFISALRADDVVYDMTFNFIRGYEAEMPVRLTYGKSVTEQTVYKKASLPAKQKIRGMEFVAPQGYGVHFDSDPSQIVPIIQGLGVDGGIVIYHHPAVFPSSDKGYLTTVAVAYDRNGTKVLQYTTNFRFSVSDYIGDADKGKHKVLDVDAVKIALVNYAEIAGKEFAQKFRSMMER